MKRSLRHSFKTRSFKIIAAAVATTGAIVTTVAALAATFGQQDLDQARVVAIAAPVGTTGNHQLLVVQQLSDARPCYAESGSNPVVVTPLLLEFDFTGICGRATDSNGYSIRVAGEDLGLQYSLRVVNRSGDLVLLGVPSDRRTRREITIARANGTTPGFAKLVLEPGWQFTRRTFNDRPLGHFYLTHNEPLNLAQSPTSTPTPTPTPTRPPTPIPTPSPSPTPSPTPTPTPTPIPPTPSPTPSPTPTPTPPTINLRDINNDIYANEIRQAVQSNFISGFQDNTFRPLESVTREQLVSMVIDALRQVPGASLNVPASASGNPYPDVRSDRWSAAKIQFARQNNIISGYQDGTFRPTQPVTRAELLAVLRRAAEYGNSLRGRSIELTQTQPPRAFSDTATHWSASLVTQMSGYCGVATPVNEQGTAFEPNSPARRNYAAAATLRMLNCVRR